MLFCVPFHLAQHVTRVGAKLCYCICVAGVERHSYHRLNLAKVHNNSAVIIRCALRRQRFVIFTAPVYLIVFFNYFVVRTPDGTEAGGLGCHYVYAYAVIGGQICYTVAHEFQDLVLYESVFKHRGYDGERHILRAYARPGRAGKIHRDNIGRRDIIGFTEQLLYKLRAAFAYAHRAKSAVARVAVRAQYHASAGRKLLAHILVYHRAVRGDIYAAVPFGS